MCVAAAVAAEVPAVEVASELVAELEARVEIQQLKELEVFNTLRLSMEVLTEVLVELAANRLGCCS